MAILWAKIKLLSMALEKAFCYCLPHVEILLLSKFELLILKHRWVLLLERA